MTGLDAIDARIDALLEQTRAKIEANDRHELIGVFPTADSPGLPFTYTVGLARLGRPELIVYGLPPDVAGHMLNVLADGPAPEPGADVIVWDALAVRCLPVLPERRAEAEVNTARRLYGDVDVWQVVFPDPAGRYPGEDGCEYDGVLPLLSVVPA